MKITCSNFGPIREGSLNISKNLIIICGANNSGKTYFSYLLYGLLKASINFQVDKSFIPIKAFRIIDHESLSDTLDVGAIVDVVKLFQSSKQEILMSLSTYAQDCVQTIFPPGADLTLAKFTFSEIPDTDFVKALFRTGLENSAIFNSPINSENNPKSFRLFKKPNANDIEIRISEKKTTRSVDSLTVEDLEIVHHAILREFLRLAFKIKKNEIKFFPAERMAIDIFSNAISNSRQEILQEIEAAQIKAYASKDVTAQTFFSLLFQSPPDNFYSAPLKDAIVSSAVIFMHSKEEGPLAGLAHLLEEQILQGALSFGSKEERYEIKFTATGAPPVKIELASSLVKALAPIALYFKHQATPRDIIIIDEPELCLHPALQRKFAVILARAVNKGIKVIISTHSDFFIREFNNLIMLHQTSDAALALRKKYLALGYDSNATLNFETVGINLFANNAIEEIECSETGFSVPLIDEVINDQNNVSQDIFFSLF